MASKKDSGIRETLSHNGFGRSRTIPGWRAIIALGLLAVAAIVGISTQFDLSETTEARIVRGGKIRIGYALESPFAFLDEHGQVTGESPEVARTIWQKLGVTDIEWVRTDFALLINQLREGRFDQIASGMLIRPDRERLVDFSSPSVCIQAALLVREGNPKNLHSFEDIAKQDGVRLAVLTNKVAGEDAARAGVPHDRIIRYPNPEMAVRGLSAGMIDALALSSSSVQKILSVNSALERAVPFETANATVGCTAFAFRQTDRALRDRFDREFRTFIGSKEHLELIRQFGFSAEDLPGHQKKLNPRSVE